mgnify:CR=1 FL=1
MAERINLIEEESWKFISYEDGSEEHRDGRLGLIGVDDIDDACAPILAEVLCALYEGEDTFCSKAEAEANARLMAAAPDLLKALLSLLGATEELCEYESVTHSEMYLMGPSTEAHDAITKALGEFPQGGE